MNTDRMKCRGSAASTSAHRLASCLPIKEPTLTPYDAEHGPEPTRPARCAACGLDLREVTDTVCPECGYPLAESLREEREGPREGPAPGWHRREAWVAAGIIIGFNLLLVVLFVPVAQAAAGPMNLAQVGVCAWGIMTLINGGMLLHAIHNEEVAEPIAVGAGVGVFICLAAACGTVFWWARVVMGP